MEILNAILPVLLYIFGIILLIVLIILPPVTRIFLKEDTTSSSNNNAVNGNTPSVSTTPPETTTTPSVPQEPLTEWEKLGISEYEYYNAKLFEWEEVAYKDINQCISEASRINTTYGFVTNYGTVSGKYVNTVGCWVIVNVNGKEYYLNEFKNLGYN